MTSTMKENSLTYSAIYLTTFVEGCEVSTPEQIALKLSKLDPDSFTPSQCTLEINEKGIEIFNEAKKRLKFSPWQKISEQSVISLEKNEHINLFTYKIRHTVVDLLGFSKEVLVFKVKDETQGKTMVEQIAKLRKSKSLTSIEDEEPKQMSRQEISSKILSESMHGENLYLLNRALNDVEHFIKQLSRYLKKQQKRDTVKENAKKQRPIEPPSMEDAVEAVRKTKFALNLTDSLKDCAPETLNKVYIRLIQFVDWLNGTCQNQLVPDYPVNMVREVVEPLLHESTLGTINALLDPTTKDMWVQLGRPWNTPSEKWTDKLEPYTPRFRAPPNCTMSTGRAVHTTLRQRKSSFHGHGSQEDLDQILLAKVTRPTIRNRRYGEHFENIQRQGGRLCFATVPHFGVKRRELQAERGDLFELLDDSRQSWWKVRNYFGSSGHIPAWKLQSVVLTPDMLTARAPPAAELARFPALKSALFETSPHVRPQQTSSFAELGSRSDLSTRDRLRAQSLGALARAGTLDNPDNPLGPDTAAPLVVCLTPDQVYDLEDTKPALPVRLFTYHGDRMSHRPPFGPGTRLALRPLNQYDKFAEYLLYTTGYPWTLQEEYPFSAHPRASSLYRPTITLT